ncbi:hypothetical protein U1Q18_005429, partial [Sarracenia purpurea var. burkii]
MAPYFSLLRTIWTFQRLFGKQFKSFAFIKCFSSSPLPVDHHHFYDNNNLHGGFDPSLFYTNLLCSSTSKMHLNQIHAQLVVSGLQDNGLIVTKFIYVGAYIGEICYAREVFDEFPDPYVHLWNAIIRGYSRNNLFGEAIEMYWRMKIWRNGQALEALRTFSEMRKLNVVPDWIALVSVLKAYTDVEDLGHGKSIHGCVIKMGLELEPDLRIGLTAMYAKCGQVMVAKSLFDQLELHNVILWNAMISGYAKNGYPDEA